MGLRCGIVGLPNVGKSTLFNAISNAKAESANYPFCTIEPNVGVITVPDERLQILEELVNPQRVLPTVIEFVDDLPRNYLGKVLKTDLRKQFGEAKSGA